MSDDDDTQSSARVDPRAEPPDQPKTVSLPAMTDRALLEDMRAVVRNMADGIGALRQDVTVLMEDRPVLHSRLAGVEGRLARVESPSMQPPPPLTSERVRAISDDHLSKPDLELQAAQAAAAVRDAERDRHIAETRALAEQAATKGDIAKLTAETATKAEVKEIANAQTTDIVSSTITGVEALAKRNTTVRNLLIAFGVLAATALMAATNYLTRPAPIAPQPIQLQVTK